MRSSRNAKKATARHVDYAKFRALMVECGLTQAELADRVEATQGTVSAWCTGKRQPPGAAWAYLTLLHAVRTVSR